ncbi:MAG TPA: SUMF1/EgtB/PvdO family nonheme iron enzyme, partial [Ktedonobacterales bacterium]
MSTIFLSYRRDDSAAACGRVYDRLAGHFGKDLVFKDVDDIPYGVNFPEYLAEKLRECRVQLVIIGKYWLTLTGPDGGRRLDAPNDFVRIEVEAGLRNGLLIVPLLVDNARMPEADDLPESIRLLTERNAAQVRPDPDFHTDMERLIRRLEDLLGMPHTSYTGGASAQAPDPVIVQLVQEIEAAYGAQSWRLVIDKAHYLLAKAGTNTPPIAILRYGQALLAAGDVAEASSALGTLHQQKIGDLRILREAADALAQAKDYTGAAALLEDGLALAENDADRLALLTAYCYVLMQLERWDLVLTRATEGSRLAPDNPMWPRWICDATGRLGRFTEALALARTLTARPDATVYDWLARAQLAYAVANNVASEEAHSALDSAARLSADDHPAVTQARDQILPLPAKLASLGFTLRSRDGVEFIVPPLCEVPAGAFEMGTQLQFFPDDARSLKSGRPQHTVKVDAFQIGRFPVTVAEYACFVRAGYYRPGDLKWDASLQDGAKWRHQLRRPDHPVVGVD